MRKRRPSGNISINSQLSIFSQTSLSTDTTTTTETSQTQSIRSVHNQSSHHIAQTPQTPHSTQQQLQLKQLQSSPHSTIATHSSHSKPIKIIGNDKMVDTGVKAKYNYHDEPHSFENSMEFLEDYKNFQFEVLETTV